MTKNQQGPFTNTLIQNTPSEPKKAHYTEVSASDDGENEVLVIEDSPEVVGTRHGLSGSRRQSRVRGLELHRTSLAQSAESPHGASAAIKILASPTNGPKRPRQSMQRQPSETRYQQ